MTGIFAIIGTVLFVVRVGQMTRTWWLKRRHAATRLQKPGAQK